MKVGDIVVCSTTQYGSYKNDDLIVGDKYIITEIISISPTDDPFYVFKHEKTGGSFILRRNFFIPLYVYREFKLKQILD